MAAEASPSPEPADAVFTLEAHATYRRPTTINHWQLRDLISPQDNERGFYCVHEAQVYAYDTVRRASTLVSDLGFAANSMTARLGFLAAGGLHGELEVRDLSGGADNSAVVYKGAVGSTVNNALHIAAPAAGGGDDARARLFVCCNDSSVRAYALPSMAPAGAIRCPCPINYCALSPDGRQLAAAGDCEPTLLYQATPAGFTLLSSLKEHACDVGMCCAWNGHGTLLAACSQDGAVTVWDARSGACVAAMTLPSAARCVKFSAAPLDLLAVSEHERRVSLVDARRWDARQTLALSPPPSPESSPTATTTMTSRGGGGGGGRGGAGAGLGVGVAVGGGAAAGAGDVSGIAFTPSGARLWVGTEAAVAAYDIDTVARRCHFTSVTVS